MRKLIVDEWLTLDGVAQAPMEADEDTSGGFAHGGWHQPFVDPDFQAWMLDNLNSAGGFVLGRRTYEGFASHWPNASDEEQPIAEPLNKAPKYVATHTLSDPLDWQNSTVLDGDLTESINALKRSDDGDLHVIGSINLVRSLLERDLVDEFRMIIDPVTVGGGKALFVDDGKQRNMRLLDSNTTPKGSIIVRYAVEAR